MCELTTTNMLAHERHEALSSLLREHGTIMVSAVARDWGVSEMTIRRDLKRLEEQGLLSRIHGGAVAGGQLRFEARLSLDRRDKAAAVDKLVDLLPETGSCYLDGSTTIYGLVDALAKRPGLTVATNNVDTFARLGRVVGCEAVLIGGTLNDATDNLVGPLARRCIDGLAFDAAFCSAFAMDPRLGPCEPFLEDAEIKRLVAERSRRVHIVVNNQKLGQRAPAAWSPGPGPVLATDLDPADERLAPYREHFPTIL
jgi:DeoR/GlpR family transcriptional regulator of sugar metabolism